MIPYPLDKQMCTVDSNSSHDWLMNLAMDLAALCNIKNVELKMAPVNAIWLFSVLM